MPRRPPRAEKARRDLAAIAPDGAVRLLGRTTKIVNTGGLKVERGLLAQTYAQSVGG